jgi:hypothetical protein
MNEYNNVLVCDLDGVLCDSTWREHHARAHNWDQFHAGIPQDKPCQNILHLVRMWREHHYDQDVLFLTGRPEAHFHVTRAWLAKHVGDWTRNSDLLMRMSFDRRSDAIVKPEMLSIWMTDNEVPKSNISLILEDRDHVVARWRELGFTCLQVKAGGY